MYMNPMEETSGYDVEQAREIGKGWWILLLVGIISLIFGFFVLGTTWTLNGVAILFSVILIFRGIMQAISAGSYRGGTRTWNLVMGIFSILVGIAVLIIPARTLLFIAVFVGVWLVITGLFDIAGSIAARKTAPYWWLALVRGIIAVPLGLWALDRPVQTVALLVFIIGIWAVIVGILEIVLAFEVRRLARTIEQGGWQAQPGTA